MSYYWLLSYFYILIIIHLVLIRHLFTLRMNPVNPEVHKPFVRLCNILWWLHQALHHWLDTKPLPQQTHTYASGFMALRNVNKAYICFFSGINLFDEVILYFVHVPAFCQNQTPANWVFSADQSWFGFNVQMFTLSQVCSCCVKKRNKYQRSRDSTVTSTWVGAQEKVNSTFNSVHGSSFYRLKVPQWSF